MQVVHPFVLEHLSQLSFGKTVEHRSHFKIRTWSSGQLPKHVFSSLLITKPSLQLLHKRSLLLQSRQLDGQLTQASFDLSP
jgi:hypothetical protein